MANRNNSLEVRGTAVKIKTVGSDDFICLTDIAKSKNPEHPDDLIRNWLRNRNTLELLGIWEQLHNPDFNPVEFDGIRKQAGLNSFTLTPKQWIEKVNALGIQSKTGRYGGTYAHKDIAFEFASWVSVEFKLYLITDFQRLKEEENTRLSLSWNLNRTLSKINYRIHTDAIKAELIPSEVTKAQAAKTYASEADLL
ncbi:MAG: KilA-N domain-containing protein, partial [Desulfuromonas sp.]|nr:KilA-N domain-containing protein [Desulfuromonas sp.]